MLFISCVPVGHLAGYTLFFLFLQPLDVKKSLFVSLVLHPLLLRPLLHITDSGLQS